MEGRRDARKERAVFTCGSSLKQVFIFFELNYSFFLYSFIYQVYTFLTFGFAFFFLILWGG